MKPQYNFLILFILIHLFSISNLQAKTAIDVISELNEKVSTLRKTVSDPLKITEHNKEITEIAIGKKYDVDFTRRATEEERRIVLRGLIQNALTNPEDCFRHFVNPTRYNEKYIGHLKWVFMMQAAAHLVIKNRAGLLWDKEMFIAQTCGTFYYDYLKKTNLSTEWQMKLRRALGLSSQEYMGSALTTMFFDELHGLTYQYPDIKDQWLAEVAHIKRLKDPQLVCKDPSTGHTIYSDTTGRHIAIEKPFITTDLHRSNRPRLYQFELACTEIAEACGLEDVIAPVVEYKENTIEPYISIIDKPSQSQVNVREFVKAVKEVNMWRNVKPVPRRGEFDTSAPKLMSNSLALGEVLSFLKEGRKFILEPDIFSNPPIKAEEYLKCLSFFRQSIDATNLAKTISLWYLLLLMDFHNGNVLLAFDENGKFKFKVTDCEYALDKNFMDNYKKNSDIILDRLNATRDLLLLIDQTPIMKPIFEHINVEEISKIASKPKYKLSAKSIEDLKARINTLKNAAWDNKNIKQVFSDIFIQTAWRGDFRVLLNTPKKCSYLQAENIKELERLSEQAPLFITSDKNIRELIEKEFAIQKTEKKYGNAIAAIKEKIKGLAKK